MNAPAAETFDEFVVQARVGWLEKATELGLPQEEAEDLYDAAFMFGESTGQLTAVRLITEHGPKRGVEALRMLNAADAAVNGIDL